MKKHTYTDEFEAFWSAYPKFVGNPKYPAFQEWQRAVKIEEQQNIIEAASRYQAHIQHERKTKDWLSPCHARTWLHQRRWEGFQPEQRQPVADKPIINSARDDVRQALMALAQEIGIDRFNSWFSDAHFIQQMRIKGSGWGSSQGIIVKGSFRCDYIKSNFADRISSLLGDDFLVLTRPNEHTFRDDGSPFIHTNVDNVTRETEVAK